MNTLKIQELTRWRYIYFLLLVNNPGLLANHSDFACEDINGLPWLEVDFPEDVERAIKQILPAIQKNIADF